MQADVKAEIYNEMDTTHGNKSQNTEVLFYETRDYTKSSIARLIVTRGVGSTHSHLLIAVRDQRGRLQTVVLSDVRNAGNTVRLHGFKENEYYTVQVCGLKLEPASEYGRLGKRSKTVLYALETGQRVLIYPPVAKGTTAVTLSPITKPDQFLESIKSHDEFEAEISEGDPLSYKLKPYLPPGCTSGLYIIFNERQKKEYLLLSSDLDSVPLLPVCLSRTDFSIKAVGLRITYKDNPTVFEPCGITRPLQIKTRMSTAELHMLMKMAEKYLQSNSKQPSKYTIRNFYRNKPGEYFDDIMNNEDGIMKKYIKDNNGDPHSLINHQIDGLFFSASLGKKRRPPYFSFFGYKRLFVPCEALYSSDMNMYFADFYCNNKDSMVHYVTVVLAKKDSTEDRFCEPRLIKLNPSCNPFFTVTEMPISSLFSLPSQESVQRTFQLASAEKFHVEFLYTEDVNIAELMSQYGSDRVRMKNVKPKGRGKSKKDGIPKVSTCEICNLPAPGW